MTIAIDIDALTLLIRLAELGVRVTAAGGNLQVTPWSRVPEDLRQALRIQKSALLDVLAYDPGEQIGIGASPALRCHSIIWRIAWSHDAERIGADDETPDAELLQAARVMVERIRAQQARGYFPGGRWLRVQPEFQEIAR